MLFLELILIYVVGYVANISSFIVAGAEEVDSGLYRTTDAALAGWDCKC